MWNSNSLISRLVVRSGLDLDSVALSAGGRAPGYGPASSLRAANKR
jgi:hypothetical protein